ncbi:transcription termination/antitermination protein NusG [Hydrogenibacillus sp. N12]|uniref:transcription termination/antitermination protein NusG n=1 Tax=Hydrogenibacillus sp. N12 TaxID=2866627 RepID=UPI0019F14873|nr:transcription termination/antitermination protein NusG [Hydrogenibacillus sp. N12]MBE3563225.1 transcription termination/antitermination protein NusG [Hydrogenibacillus schlegelii]QZA33113.1 transcription termination/antitermination protein NusG [Hydrogenibacillus sp. N12]
MSPEKRWYVVHTYSGYEKKVEANLKKRIESMGMEDQIFRIVVPVEETEEIKDGRAKTVQRKIFPGYVLVEMIMTDESWSVVRNTPGVTGFVGSMGPGTKPIPLEPEEAERILRAMGMAEERRPRVDLAVGERVRIREGPFADVTGRIEAVDVERGKVVVSALLFGRETPIECEATQVERV